MQTKTILPPSVEMLDALYAHRLKLAKNECDFLSDLDDFNRSGTRLIVSKAQAVWLADIYVKAVIDDDADFEVIE